MGFDRGGSDGTPLRAGVFLRDRNTLLVPAEVKQFTSFAPLTKQKSDERHIFVGFFLGGSDGTRTRDLHSDSVAL